MMSGLKLNQIFPDRFGHGFVTGVDLKLGVDVFNVRVDGVKADMPPGGNSFYRQPLHQQIQNLFFPVGQAIFFVNRGFDKPVQNFLCNLGIDWRTAIHSIPNGLLNLFG